MEESTLDSARRTVAALAVGESVSIAADDLTLIGSDARDDETWSAVDQIMCGIAGSAYSIRIAAADPATGAITFQRIEVPDKGDLRTWVLPHQRKRFKQRSDGYWESRTP